MPALIAAPQPSPATPSEVLGWYDLLNSAEEAGYTKPEAQARAVAAEAARRESGLREKCVELEDIIQRYARDYETALDDNNRIRLELAIAAVCRETPLDGHAGSNLELACISLAIYETQRRKAAEEGK